MSSFVECTCGDKRRMSEMADHLRKEHLETDLPYSCGVCDFSATSEGAFLGHCIAFEHDPRKDQKVLVSIFIL